MDKEQIIKAVLTVFKNVKLDRKQLEAEADRLYEYAKVQSDNEADIRRYVTGKLARYVNKHIPAAKVHKLKW